MPEYPPLICSIDPGASGGIAFLDARLSVPADSAIPYFVAAYKMPETEDDLADLLREFPIACAYVEIIQYGGSPKDGAQRGMSSSIKFGINYGMIRGALAALKIRRVFVHPQKWQAAMGIPKRGNKTKTQHKNVLKAMAQQLFPMIPKITLSVCDALLIAEYGRGIERID